jgi:hypothetical protein
MQRLGSSPTRTSTFLMRALASILPATDTGGDFPAIHALVTSVVFPLVCLSDPDPGGQLIMDPAGSASCLDIFLATEKNRLSNTVGGKHDIIKY